MRKGIVIQYKENVVLPDLSSRKHRQPERNEDGDAKVGDTIKPRR
jgi:hypothetical protein